MLPIIRLLFLCLLAVPAYAQQGFLSGYSYPGIGSTSSSGGGGGTSGTVSGASPQVGFFTGTNAVGGSNNFTWTGTALVVSGTVSATHFVGDGSGLTGISASVTSLDYDSLTNVPPQVQNVSTGAPVTLGAVTSTGAITATTSLGIPTGGYLSGGSFLTIQGSNAGTPQSLFFNPNGGGIIFGAAEIWQPPQQFSSGFDNFGLPVSATAFITTGQVSATNISASTLWMQTTGGIRFAAASAPINWNSGPGLFQVGGNTMVALRNNGLLISGNTTASTQPSASLHVSGSTLTTSWTGINFSSAANVTPTEPLEVSGTISATNLLVTNITVSGTCTNCGSGGGGTSISTTTFTAASNVSASTDVGFNAAVGTGRENTVFGANSGVALSTGTSNTFIGSSAGRAENTDSNDVLIGAGAGQKLAATGGVNTAIGAQAMVAATSSAIRNTAVGFQSLSGITSGAAMDNVAVGDTAGSGLLTGVRNVFLGSAATMNGAATDNVVIGYQAGASSSSNQATIVGSQAANVNGTLTNVAAFGFNTLNRVNGQSNAAFGAEAGILVTTGASNTLVGTKTAQTLTTGSNNLLIGAGADVLAATGSNQMNIANSVYGDLRGGGVSRIGINVTSPTVQLDISGTINATSYNLNGSGFSLYALSDVKGSASVGSNTLYLGNGAGATNSGTVSVAVGIGALNGITTGTEDVAMGYNTAFSATTGSYNTMVGRAAMYYNLAGSYNVAIGQLAGVGSGTGGTPSTSVFIGAGAGTAISTSQGNFMGGYNSGVAVTTGSSNTLIGSASGNTLTTGSNNILIGALANPVANTGSNQFNLGNSFYGDLRGSGVSRLGVNVTSPTSAFEVSGTVAFDNILSAAGLDYLCYSSATGQVTYSATTCTVSDRKFKKAIQPYTQSLQKVMQLAVREFEFNDPAYGKGRQVGLIAQEVEPVVPQMVGHGSNGDLSVDYAKLSVLALGAIQEQQKMLDHQEDQIILLRKEVEAFKYRHGFH